MHEHTHCMCIETGSITRLGKTLQSTQISIIMQTCKSYKQKIAGNKYELAAIIQTDALV